MASILFTPTNLNAFDILTLDFETAYQSAKGKGQLTDKYTLKSLTYEEYIFHEHYKEHGVGIKINTAPAHYYRGRDIELVLSEIFDHRERPICLVCHNTLFDGAILSWRYGIVADFYTCTLSLSRALWPSKSHSLEALALRVFPDDDTKRKTHELESIDGLWTLNPEQDAALEQYCINDVELTFDCFMQLYQYTPEHEFDVLDTTLRMFIVPGLQLDSGTVAQYLEDLQTQRENYIRTIHATYNIETEVIQAAHKAEAWGKEHNTQVNMTAYIDEAIRTWKHELGYTRRKARKKDTDALKEVMAHQSELFKKGLFCHPFCLLAWRIVFDKQESGEKITDMILSGADYFATYLEYVHGLRVERKASPTPKNKHNTSWALAKDDIPFLDMRRENPNHEPLFRAKLFVSSTIEMSRAERLLLHAKLLDGWLAAPLTYCGAHTKRWAGTNKVNFQNFGRKSPIRRALMAPKGYFVGVADLSNIESRVLAWFANCHILNMAYAEDRDLYSEFASIIYGYPVDRKMKCLDENGTEIVPHYLEGLVGKVSILGLGYGMGWRTLQVTFAKGAMGADPIFFDDIQSQDIVNKYRNTYPEIPALWQRADQVIYDMCDPHLEPYMWGCLQVEYRRLRLPNGHYLSFDRLKVVENSDATKNTCQYWNGEFWKTLYGGLLIENIIQALSRILMAWAVVAVDKVLKKMNGRVVLTVHDEIVFIAPESAIQHALADCITIMRQPLPWCNDGTLTLDAEGDYAKNYSK